MPDAGRSWGNRPALRQTLLRLHRREALPTFEDNALPHGNGRSYGDSCLNEGGALLYTRGLDRFIRFDAETGELECESGVLLSEIIRITLPRGWFPAVTPGTQFVTVGGAIANDVHGKNHHRTGSFGHHVLGLSLLRSDGRRLNCSAQENAELFRATIGGLGLTGLILSVRLRLTRVAGTWMEAESQRFASLDEFFALSRESDARFEHTVAWVDCSARGDALGRGVFQRAHWSDEVLPAPRQRHWRAPFTPPFSLVNPMSVRLFNAWHFHRPGAEHAPRLCHHRPWLYPLDGIEDWNRAYGTSGFLQYQCVLPPKTARDGLREILARIAASGEASFLAVLKQFGERGGAGLMSFARPGTTLAVDFPHRGVSTLALLESLDVITCAAGGAVYPAKDARMSAAAFAAYYPQWPQLERWRDPAFSSSFWRRVTQSL